MPSRHPAVPLQPSVDLEISGKSAAGLLLKDLCQQAGLAQKQLAIDLEWSEGQVSKMLARADLALVYHAAFPREVRVAFLTSLASGEQADPEEMAAEQLAVAAVRFLRIRGSPVKAQLTPNTRRAPSAATGRGSEGKRNA